MAASGPPPAPSRSSNSSSSSSSGGSLLDWFAGLAREILPATSGTSASQLPPPNVLAWRGEAAFQTLLHEGKPVLLALTLPGVMECDSLRRPLSRAAAAFPDVRFVWVNCARSDARSFCQARGLKELPHLVMIHMPIERQLRQSSMQDGDTADYVASVHAFKHDWSLYGFRCFLQSSGVLQPDGVDSSYASADHHDHHHDHHHDNHEHHDLHTAPDADKGGADD